MKKHFKQTIQYNFSLLFLSFLFNLNCNLISNSNKGSDSDIFTTLLLANLTSSSPIISSIEPSEGIIGHRITISGSNFSSYQSSVRFNGVSAEILQASATILTVNVPQGATTGKITIQNSSGNSVTSENFFSVYKYTVTTLAGSAGNSGHIDATGSSARFSNPYGLITDSSANIYATGNSIRKITPLGVVTTFAGSATGINGTADGTGTAARFFGAQSATVDSSGNLYVADKFNHTIRKISTTGVVTTFAGTAGSFGSTDANGIAARFRNPHGVTIDSAGNLYVTDTDNHTIRKITSSGNVTTFAGMSGVSGSTDGLGSSARFSSPSAIVADSNGNLYTIDAVNKLIRKITSSGEVTSFAGNSNLDGNGLDGQGNKASFDLAYGMAIDSTGNLYIADTFNHKIRKVTPNGYVYTIAGSGSIGSVDGENYSASFREPVGIAVDSNGIIYVSDTQNQIIRKIIP
ncbi:IPT/TIG domain-containing protein [Leptospira kanakyensis]|uniref:IPT/TIG domain-containing protein n=1 Tax=Leptospira kanakyensis TaxID=2484968 RepID=UPI00223D5890|nr:IPT/TIG domain-containing protein [Leptospira kanakyensis]MCW7471555.1 IPT/TIG domain-containing protein [Leptospira kanakyensis]